MSTIDKQANDTCTTDHCAVDSNKTGLLNAKNTSSPYPFKEPTVWRKSLSLLAGLSLCFMISACSDDDDDDDSVPDVANDANTNTTVAVNGNVEGDIDDAEDEDWFKVTLVADKTYKFDLEGKDTDKGTLTDPGLKLYLPDGETEFPTDDPSITNNNERVTYSVQAGDGGDYFLVVFGEDGSTGTYKLSVAEETGSFGGGAGTEADPYRITAIAHLNNIRDNDGGENYLDDHFILLNDLDFDGYTYADNAKKWKPIGNIEEVEDSDGDERLEGVPFSGSFNGNGKKISNLQIARGDEDQIGLFGVIAGGINSDGDELTSGGKVKDLGLEGVNVVGDDNVGALAGLNGGTIENSYSTGEISARDNRAGGLVGDNGGTVSKSYSTAKVSDVGFGSGGLVGNNSGTVSKSYATGAVSGGGAAGGLVGENGGTVENSYATGAVSASDEYAYVGGLAGYNDGAISKSYATGAVSAPGANSSIGGILGYNGEGYEDTPDGTLENSYYNTTTSGATESIGSGGGSSTNVEGLTTAEMYVQANFVGFDFNGIWNAPTASTFPTLRE